MAIVDVTTGRVVSVVGRSYRLVSHKEALNLAFDCAAAAFPGMKTDQWQVVLVDAPSTGGTCFIDLAHNSALLDSTGVAAANLCRYITRPALANERVQCNAAGQGVLKLKTAWHDGTTHIVMLPLEFIQRLAALVPRPRLHLIRLVSA